MKSLVLLSTILFTNLVYSQSNFPTFLAGTWKVHGSEAYEHWDLMSPTSLKGYSYSMEDNKSHVSEYLELTQKGKSLTYTASVVGQNDGVPVSFKSTQSDSVFVFENPKHDFPQKIVYYKITDNEMGVILYGGDMKSTMAMTRINVQSDSPNPNYDAELAEKLGGDDYGMKNYIFVVLKTGDNKTTDRAYIDSCFMGHMANMGTLVDQGKLVVAGPFGKNDQNMRGLFILNVATIEEAQDLLQTDPAIKANLLKPELFPWYGSAALPMYLDDVEKIWREKF